MTTGTVLVLPTASGRAGGRVEFLDEGLRTLAIEPAQGPAEAFCARICAAINEADPAGPLHVVAYGATARLLPAVALGQRAMHRRVAEYVLVDPDMPDVSDAWPDAPVSVYLTDTTTPAASQGRLRGWPVHPLAALGERAPGR